MSPLLQAPDVLAALRPLAGAIGADTMRRPKAIVDQDGESAGTVARAFIERREEGAQPRAVRRVCKRASAGGKMNRSRTAPATPCATNAGTSNSRSAASTSASVARVVGCSGVNNEQQS